VVRSEVAQRDLTMRGVRATALRTILPRNPFFRRGGNPRDPQGNRLGGYGLKVRPLR